MTELDQEIIEVVNKMNSLRKEAENAGVADNVDRVLLVLETLEVLQKREVEVELNYSEECAWLELEVGELDEMLRRDDCEGSFSQCVDSLLADAVERLNVEKTDLASKLREITSLKGQRDDVPVQAELMQYEWRFSELNAHIQGRLRQTRKYYATYNALLEIKELMLKETSFLNSMSSPAGRATLTSSIDGISRSSQQECTRNEKLQNQTSEINI